MGLFHKELSDYKVMEKYKKALMTFMCSEKPKNIGCI